MFVDEVKIFVKAGDGGDGCISFRREKFVPKGGPNGGDGGNGGDVFLEVDDRIRTLIDLKHHPHNKAERGSHGKGKDLHGKRGASLIIKVPMGTIVYEAKTNEEIVDLTKLGEKVLIVKGGRGGRGNARFATSTNQAPRIAEEGGEGEEKSLRLDLKVLAEVGLIGFPNAGKSTLISRISKAKPKIADYPFTTLAPHLGVVRVEEFKSFIIADIPGLIENAHKGVGLGSRFLRHIERTKLLVHVIDITTIKSKNPIKDFQIINKELELFNPEIASKPQIVVANKMDLPEAKKNFKKLENFCEQKGFSLFPISALTGKGLKPLVFHIMKTLEKL